MLGASSTNIMAMLSKDILKLVIISFMLNSPIAFFAMNRWLQHFAFRTTVNAMFFIRAGLFAPNKKI
jgi:putative ABC transport system permease protein